ncbi:MAG: ABC transporter permease [Saprospiraceae bacterium]|nr:ABC transporter permease [Lewinella sp.]
MRSIFLVAYANIKRRKLQSLLIGGSIVLAAMLLATTIGLLMGMNKPFDTLFEQQKASHLLLFFDHRQQDSEGLDQWFRSQTEVASVSAPIPYYTLDEPAIFKGEELDLTVQLTEHHEGNLVQDQVLILQGDPKPHPALGEIWIPSHLAQNHGIQIGDTLGIPTREGLFPLIVSAMIVDPHYVSSMFNPTRAWVAPGSLSFFLPISQLNRQMMGIRLKSPDQVETVWSRFNKHQLYEGEVLKYGLFRSVFLSFYQIISLVLLVFSVLAVIAALFILYTTLSGSITADFRLIGIYKAQGFTPGQLRAVYLLQYLLLTLVSLPLGMVGSYYLIRAILDALVRSIGLANTSFSFLIPLMITFGLFVVVVAGLSYLGSLKATRIKPVEAIRLDPSVGAYSSSPFSGLLVQAHVPIPFFLGLRMLFANPKRGIYTALSLLFAIFILVFSINTSFSFLKLKDNKAAWGLEDSDIQVRLNKKIALPLEHDAFISLLEKESAIATVVPYSYCSGTIPASGQLASQELNGKVYTGPISDLGLDNLQGRHPQREDELSLCLISAEELGKQAGDSLTLFIEGQEKVFLISGIYQDVSNLGRGFRLAEPAMKALSPLFEPELYAIRLKPGLSVADFKDHLQQTFAETVLLELSVEERKGIQTTISSMRSTLLLVAVFFLSIIFAVLFNDALTNIHEFRKSFGLLKTIGMLPYQVRLALVIRVLLLTVCCLIFGIPLAMMLSPHLISTMTGGIGLQEFPYLNDVSGVLSIIPAMLLFTGLSAWWASGKLKKITVKDLVSLQ